MQETILYPYEGLEDITQETIDIVNGYLDSKGVKASIKNIVDWEGTMGLGIIFDCEGAIRDQMILSIGILIGAFFQELQGKRDLI